MTPLPPHVLILSVLTLLGVGCNTVREVSEWEREESFRSMEDRKVGSETLREFVLRRTALLVNVEDLTVLDQTDRSEAILGGSPRTDSDLIFGSAAAVDSRGYFVTAAHCIEDRTLSVVFWTEKGLSAVPARLVYLGDPSSRFAGFAVIHVPVRLENVFRWGRPPSPGATIVSAGISDRSGSDSMNGFATQFILEPVAGPLMEVVEREVEGVRFQLLRHDSPLERGNSGGPVVDPKGRLLAVNSTGPAAFPVLGAREFRYSSAVRPDPEWLADLIRRDVHRGSDS